MAAAAEKIVPIKQKKVVIDHLGADDGNGTGKFHVLGRPKTIIFPSIASPADRMLDDSMADAADVEPLMVDGQAWYAGVEPDATTWPPTVNEQRGLTSDHMALFLEGVDRAGADQINSVVIGVPISQASDKGLIAQLIDRYQRTHVVRGRDVVIKKVNVVAEPLGTAWAYADQKGIDIGGQTVLLGDFGYGTTNLVRFVISIIDGEINIKVDPFTAKSYWLGASQVCEELSQAIKQEHGASVSPHKISAMLRQRDCDISKMTIRRMGKDIPFGEHAEKIIAEHSSILFGKILQDMRGELGNVDVFLGSGGFAPAMKKWACHHLPLPVEIMKNPMDANARGFAFMAKAYDQK